MEEKVRYFLYYLADPRNGLPVYIGRTFNPRQRYKQHSNFKNTADIPEIRKLWLAKLSREGIALKMVVFAEMPSLEISQAAESYVSFTLIKKGYALVNGINSLSTLEYVDNTDLIGRLTDTIDSSWMAATNNIYYPSTEILIYAESFKNVTVRVQVIVSDDVLERLLIQAKKESRSLSDLARKYIVEGAQKDEEKK